MLTPTRELAIQVAKDFKDIVKTLSVVCFYGGSSYNPQSKSSHQFIVEEALKNIKSFKKLFVALLSLYFMFLKYHFCYSIILPCSDVMICSPSQRRFSRRQHILHVNINNSPDRSLLFVQLMQSVVESTFWLAPLVALKTTFRTINWTSLN